MRTLDNYIDGAFVAPKSGEYLDVFEPGTGEIYARVASSSSEDIDTAVEAARRAFPGWSRTPAAERSAILLRVADGIDARLEELARAEAMDNGKPIWLARNVDIPRAASNFRFFATQILHEQSEAHFTDDRALNYTIRAPRGVAALISPWNLPLYLFTWKVAPAIATGNTGVGKPSEVTPLTATILGEILSEAGLPPGVLNIVHGLGPNAGQALVEHRDVSAVSFTGGTATGAAIARSAAPQFKKLSLELGGKNPNLIFEDADLEIALDETVRAGFSNQGQICLCGSRILVQESVHDDFVDQLTKRVGALNPGDPLDEDTRFGALVSHDHMIKVAAAVDRARSDGGTVRVGGERVAIGGRCEKGYFYAPTVITGLDASCDANQEEIFGPVVTIQPFRDEAEALEIANGTRYGLACSIWTRDVDRAHRVAREIDSGIVWINTWMLRDLRVPFGGMKDSGVGREGGLEAMRFFTEPKNVCLRTP